MSFVIRVAQIALSAILADNEATPLSRYALWNWLMEVGVKLRPSGTAFEHDPGHMGLFWKHSGVIEFRGYRFYVDDLPVEHQDSAKWREYLLHHAVPGHVFDDTITREDYELRRNRLVCKSWTVEDVEIKFLQETTMPRQVGMYSFNPDNFADCDNCVTLAANVLQSVVGEVLSRVRQGRIQLMKAELEAIQ